MLDLRDFGDLDLGLQLAYSLRKFGLIQHLGYYGSVRYLGLGFRIGFP